jgi:hypothetical protein
VFDLLYSRSKCPFQSFRLQLGYSAGFYRGGIEEEENGAITDFRHCHHDCGVCYDILQLFVYDYLWIFFYFSNNVVA